MFRIDTKKNNICMASLQTKISFAEFMQKIFFFFQINKKI